LLYLVGGISTNTNDQIQINPVGASNTGGTGVQVNATLNGVSINKTFNQSFTTILIFEYGGNNNIQLANSLTVSAIISEGNGNDNIQVGNGNTAITLGNGNDNVQAGNGSILVMAGNGNDNVQASSGNNSVTLGNGNDNVGSAARFWQSGGEGGPELVPFRAVGQGDELDEGPHHRHVPPRARPLHSQVDQLLD
jgi:hypothetical protein